MQSHLAHLGNAAAESARLPSKEALSAPGSNDGVSHNAPTLMVSGLRCLGASCRNCYFDFSPQSQTY
jgi:hypothetical protein